MIAKAEIGLAGKGLKKQLKNYCEVSANTREK